MSKQEPLSEHLVLQSLQVGAQPLIEPLLERLMLREFLQRAFAPSDLRIKLAPLHRALVLVRNFTLCRHPLYEVSECVRGRVPAQVGLEPERVGLINDDCLGRTLVKPFVADRRSMVTCFIVHMAKVFSPDWRRLHNDSPASRTRW